MVIFPSLPRVKQLEGKQALTLEAVLDKHSAVLREELGHIPIKLRLPLKPDARSVDPRAPPEPPALRDTGGRGGGGGTGGSRSRRTPVSTGMPAGARRLARTVGVSTPARR